ncbi:MAG: Hpt domain-containing protein [Cyanobacteria bacterium P01_D01_bin.44]
MYRTAGTTHLQTIEAGLHQLAQQPDDHAVLETLRKAAHTLKGDSRVMGLDAIAALSEQIEARIKQIQRAELTLTNELTGLLKQGLQVIDQLIDAAVTGIPAELDSQLMLDHLSGDIALTTHSSKPDLISPVSDQPGLDSGLVVDPAEQPLAREPLTAPLNEHLTDYLTDTALAEDPSTGTAFGSDPLTGETLTGEQLAEESTDYWVEKPFSEEPLAEDSHDHLANQPLAGESFIEEPLAQEPLAQEPLAQEPLAQESLAQEPLAETLSTEALFTTDEPSTEISWTDELAELLANGPSAGESLFGEPVASVPSAENVNNDGEPASVVVEPIVEAPNTDWLEAPLASELLAEEALAEEALAEEPMNEALVNGAFMTEEPLSEEALAEETLAEEALAEKALAEKALAEEALAEEPMNEISMIGAPATEEPLAEKPLGEETLAEKALSEDPLAEESWTDELSQLLENGPLPGTPLIGDPWVEAPSAEDVNHDFDPVPLAEAPVASEPVLKQPEVEKPLAEALNNYLAPELIADEELRSLYQSTSANRLQNLTSGLTQLVPDQTPPNQLLSDLRKELHALKGDSQILGVTIVATLAKQMEATLKAIGAQAQTLTQGVKAQLQADLALIDGWIAQATQLPTETAIAATTSPLSILNPDSQPELAAVPPLPNPNLFLDDVELREIYQLTSLDRLQMLTENLAKLTLSPLAIAADTDAVPDTDPLEILRRETHSLTADSHVVGLDSIAQLSRQFEATVKNLQQHSLTLTPLLQTQLEQSLDALQRLIQEAVTGQASGVHIPAALELLNSVATPAATPDAGEGASLNDDTEFRQLYKATSEERLQQLEAGVLQLTERPQDKTLLASLLREAHSLKGDARAADLQPIETLAHALEDIFASLQQQEIVFTADLCSNLYQSLDAIAQIVHAFTTDTLSTVNTEQVIAELMSAITPLSPPPSTPEATTSPIIEDEALREIYALTSKERLGKLETGLAHLEAHPEDAATTLASLLREAHSLKGDSASAGVETVAALTHAIETIFGSLQRQTLPFNRDLSDQLYEGFDAIAQLVDQASLGTLAPINSQQILKQLRAVTSDTAPPTSTPLSPPSETALRPPPGDNIDTIRVQTSDLDLLMGRAEQLTVTRIQIAQTTTQIKQIATLWEEWKTERNQRQQLASTDPYEASLDSLIGTLRRSAQENSDKLDLVTEDLSERIRVLRLLPLATLFQTLPRTVRDLARQQDKQVELILEGQETTADKRILEGIRDALMHLVRNAIDHGIAPPAEREAAGKSPTAKLWVRGHQTPNSIVIEVSDDGKGLDLEQIKQTALRRRLYSAEELDAMPPSQIQELILAPGFSTRTFITEISGRGVGLDVVRTNVERLQGNIQIDSSPGHGCSFRLQVSTSLTTANVVLVETLGIIHAMPIEFLQTTLLISPEQMVIDDANQVTINWNDQIVPIANLFDVLELPASAAKNSISVPANRRPCLLLKVGDSLGGFFIDHLLDTQEVVLKPQGALLKRVRNVTGATILGNGDVCMILNPPDLVKSLQRPTPAAPLPEENIRRKPLILLVEDSPPVRTQEKRLFEGAGYDVVIAEDGLEGYDLLRNGQFDVVVSDVEMPNLDGLSLTAKIRQHPEYEDLPIVLVTTLSSDADRKRGADAGADAYIPKGKFNQDVLLETLARLV